MSDIEQLRKRIDEIDDQILIALNERVNDCKAIGLAKKNQGKPVKDAFREKELLNRLKEKSSQFNLDPVQVETVYREIVNMCSAVQE